MENSVIWHGIWGAIRSVATTDDIFIVGNWILGGMPYWVSWGDCKDDPDVGAEVGPCYNTGRGTALELSDDDSTADDWTIERNLFRGGHDGIGTRGNGNSGIVIRYNVFSDFHDDPFEIEEALNIGRIDIYGNYITNSLNCFASGQDDTEVDGPIYYYSNICALARIPFIDRMQVSPRLSEVRLIPGDLTPERG